MDRLDTLRIQLIGLQGQLLVASNFKVMTHSDIVSLDGKLTYAKKSGTHADIQYIALERYEKKQLFKTYSHQHQDLSIKVENLKTEIEQYGKK